MDKLGILEGILFVVGDEGITLKRLAEVLSISYDDAKRLLKEAKEKYESDDRGIRISFIGDAFKFTTKKEHKEYYKKLLGGDDLKVLSNPSLEVLAIIAYNQPITRADIDILRGVSSSHLIRKLAAMGLIKVSGKSNMPGKPNLYSTTKAFLDYFGLATIEDLPKIEFDFEEKNEGDLFTSIYKEQDSNVDKEI